MNKSYKFRLYPNRKQEEMFSKTFGCTRFIYNKMLSDKIEYYKLNNKSIILTPAKYKKEFVWLKEIDSMALCNTQLNLQTAFINFFRNKKTGFPKFKSRKRNKFSYTTNNQKNNIRIRNKKIKLPKIGWVNIVQYREIPNNYILKSVTISKEPSGKYFASLLFQFDKVINKIVPKNIVGLDFSMKELFVSSDNEKAEYPRYYRKSLEKLKFEQRKLSNCVKGSNNRNKQRIRVSRIHEKIKNQRNDFLHKLSRKITNFYYIICVEDLNMKSMSQCLNFGKSISDNSWGKFCNILEYKLLDEGKYFIKIDKWFPSSKTCSNCGMIKETLDLSERTFECECGFVIDRDINAAINIKNQGQLVFEETNRRDYGVSSLILST